MTRFLLPSLLAASLCAADRLPVPNSDGTFPQHAVWIEGGLGTSVTDCDLTTLNIGNPSTKRQLSGDWYPGLRGGIEVQNGWTDIDGFGLSIGCGVVFERSLGQVEYASVPTGKINTSRGLAVDSTCFVLLPECTWRWDSGGFGRIIPHEWLLELGPVLGVGQGWARVEKCHPSHRGLAWQAGVRLRVSSEIARNLRLGMSVSALYESVKARWDDTGDSTIISLAPVAALALGWEF